MVATVDLPETQEVKVSIRLRPEQAALLKRVADAQVANLNAWLLSGIGSDEEREHSKALRNVYQAVVDQVP